MLTLTEDQYKKLLASDVQNFIAAVADEILSEREDMLENPGRSEVILHMQSAYDNRLNLRFTSTVHLIYMMYMSVDYPKLFEQPETQRYLSKSGVLPKQWYILMGLSIDIGEQFDCLLYVAKGHCDGGGQGITLKSMTTPISKVAKSLVPTKPQQKPRMASPRKL